METTTYRHLQGFYSSSESIERGTILLSSLRREKSEFHRAFLRLASPLGMGGALKTISGLNEDDFGECWLPGSGTPNGGGRIWLPNPWIGLPKSLIASLLETLLNDIKLRKFLKSLDSKLVPPWGSSARNWMAEGIEAIMPFYCEPLLLGASSGTLSEIGWPNDIDLDWKSAKSLSKRRIRRPNATEGYPCFSAYLARIRMQLAKKLSDFDPEPKCTELSSVNDNDRIAVNVLRWQFCIARKEQATESAIRVAQEIPWLISNLAEKTLREALSDAQIQALHLLENSRSCQDLLDANPTFSQFRAIPPRIEMTLIGPKAFEKCFNLNWYPPLNLKSISAAAMRILAILFYEAGRRCVCVSELKVKDFIGNDEHLEILIRRTKVKEMNNSYCPIGYLASERSLQFIQEWRSFMLPEYSDSRVVELVIGGDVPESEKLLHQALSKEYQIHFGTKIIPSLHDFRRFCASWIAVRMMVSQEPLLLKSPTMSCSRKTPLFNENSLKRLRNYLKSIEVDDPLELIAGALGNLRPNEIRRTYCRTWPILLALRCYSIWKKTRAL